MEKSIKTKLPMLKNLESKFDLKFDYEINTTEMDGQMDCKMYYFDSNMMEKRIVNYNSFWDELNLDNIYEKKNKNPKEIENVVKIETKKACCIKSLVSKKKRRLRLKTFDLDMSYITRRVLAMGYPSTGFEKLYRNSLEEIIRFFHEEHHDKVKIYNLCLEKDRIYNKSCFGKSFVSLFPAKDHNPCPIKLILEFCIDICLYLIKNQKGVATVHCKAGKGRTGVMICSYLIFSGLCNTSKEAFDHYGKARTFNGKGVTIPSQIRYVKYFESFLETNFYKPYLQMIPKMVKIHFGIRRENILLKFLEDNSYFISPNIFLLREIKIGPFPNRVDLKINICDFTFKNIGVENIEKTNLQSENNPKQYYFKVTFKDKLNIESDIKISVDGAGLNFYVWANLWYSSYSCLKEFMDLSKIDFKKNERLINYEKTNLKTNSNIINLELEDFNSKNELISNQTIGMKINNSEIYNNDVNLKSFGKKETLNSNQSQKENKSKSLGNLKNSKDDRNIENKVLNELDENQKILDNCDNDNKTYRVANLSDLLYKLNYNTDIEKIIDSLNSYLSELEKETFFDKNDFNICLKKEELDKFFKIKKVDPNFSLNLKYSLLCKNKNFNI